MSFSIFPDYLISRDQEAVSLANKIINQLNPIVFGEALPQMQEEALEAVQQLLEFRYPEGGDTVGLTQGEIAETVLYVIFDDMEEAARANNFRLEIRIREELNRADQLERFYIFETFPLTPEEQIPPEEEPPTPENPFDPPPEIKDGEEPPDKPPTEPPEGEPPPEGEQPPEGQEPPPRLPREEEPPETREPPPGGEERRKPPNISGGTIPIPPEDDEQPEEEKPKEEPSPGEPKPIEVDVEVRIEQGDIAEAIDRLTEEVKKQEEATREAVTEQHKQLLDTLRDIEIGVDITGQIALEDISVNLDDIQVNITEPIEAEITNLESVMELFEGLYTLDTTIAEAIRDFNRELTREVKLIGTIIDLQFSDMIVAVKNFSSAIVESQTEGLKRVHDILEKNGALNRELTEDTFRKTVDMFTFDDLTEVQNWICEIIEMFRNIVLACNLDKKQR